MISDQIENVLKKVVMHSQKDKIACMNCLMNVSKIGRKKNTQRSI